ncbi:MAG: hypothetical protein J6J00_00650 [Treponema sp.]|nr:hypothetical protein [Treponema sp.]
MLSSILKKSDCAECRFCCSFRRQSLWETPIFDAPTVKKLRALYPAAKFRPAGPSGHSFTFDISDQYKTNDPEEEARCPFLDINSGCVLPPDLKPFDCSIWPFRAVRRPDSAPLAPLAAPTTQGSPNSGELSASEPTLAVALTPTCPAINKVPRSQITELLHQGGLAKKILDYAKDHPDIIKDYSEFLSDLF